MVRSLVGLYVRLGRFQSSFISAAYRYWLRSWSRETLVWSFERRGPRTPYAKCDDSLSHPYAPKSLVRPVVVGSAAIQHLLFWHPGDVAQTCIVPHSILLFALQISPANSFVYKYLTRDAVAAAVDHNYGSIRYWFNVTVPCYRVILYQSFIYCWIYCWIYC